MVEVHAHAHTATTPEQDIMGVLTELCSAVVLNYTETIQKSRTGDPDWEDLSKPPVPVRSAHYGAKDLASVRLAWIPTFSSIPGEARVLLSSPTNAKRHRNRIPVRDGKHN